MPKLRPLSADEVCRILRQAGSHIIMRLEVPGRDSHTVPVPNHREIAKGTLKSRRGFSSTGTASEARLFNPSYCRMPHWR